MIRSSLALAITVLVAATVAGAAPAPVPGTLAFTGVVMYGDGRYDTFYAAFTVRADGTRLRRVTRWYDADGPLPQPRLAPDGSRIAWPDVSGLRVTDADGKRPRRLSARGVTDADWSPDGRYLAYASWPRRWIRIVGAAGGQPRQINVPVEPSAIRWSPNGRTLAFLGEEYDGSRDVYRIGLDGRGFRRLTNVGMPQTYVGPPEWSPDGRRIVYAVSSHAEPTLVGLWVMRADGVNPKRIVRRDHFDSFWKCCAWAPDGRAIAYVLFEDRTIAFVAPSGRALRTLRINTPVRVPGRAWARFDHVRELNWRATPTR